MAIAPWENDRECVVQEHADAPVLQWSLRWFFEYHAGHEYARDSCPSQDIRSRDITLPTVFVVCIPHHLAQKWSFFVKNVFVTVVTRCNFARLQTNIYFLRKWYLKSLNTRKKRNQSNDSLYRVVFFSQFLPKIRLLLYFLLLHCYIGYNCYTYYKLSLLIYTMV